MFGELEEDFLGYIYNDPKLIDDLEIKPKYLKNERYKKILELFIKSYNEKKCIADEYVLNSEYYVDILTLKESVLFIQSTRKERFRYLQKLILDDYKKRYIELLNKKLENNEIKYDDYIKKIDNTKKIDILGDRKDAIIDIKKINDDINEDVYIKSNIQILDKMIKGFALNELSVWSGSNASAKSTFLNQLAIESIEQGYKVAIYSGELVPSKLLKWIEMQCAGKKNMAYVKQYDYYFVDDTYKKLIKEWLSDKLFIYNNQTGNKAKDILYQLKKCIKENNIKVLILDNMMSMDIKYLGDNKYDNQSQFIQSLSDLAKELNIHIHFVCHPRKVTSFLRKEDIAGTSDLTNIADNVFIMHRVNNDFKIKTKEMFKWKDDKEIYNYTNVLEICKNRQDGIQDYFVGMYFEVGSKRLLNTKNEEKHYSWEKLIGGKNEKI